MVLLVLFFIGDVLRGQKQPRKGVVTSVAEEGVFVDIGAEAEGWVHISLLSDSFVDDPFEVVQVGDEAGCKVQRHRVARWP